MSERKIIAASAAAGLERFAGSCGKTPVMLGFDGFVDSIIAVVDKRLDSEHYEPIPTIERFGRKIVAAAGNSSNYEFVVKLEKLGGNGPIMANAMAAADLGVTYIGLLGHPAVHPVFEPLTKVASCISVASPGLTDAVEFDDGKLMLGKIEVLKELTWERVEQVVGKTRLRKIVAEARLIGMVNWTMLPHMNDIWRGLIKMLGPAGRKTRGAERKLVFIDLADPEKRTPADLRGALKLCRQLQGVADVVLGLNLKEAAAVADVLNIPAPGNGDAKVEALACDLRAKLGLHALVIHPRAGAAAARNVAGAVESASFPGPFVAKPKLSTGAGDNFNSGFCLGLLAGLPLDQALCVGTATSGYYVRNAASPTLNDLIKFCKHLPDPQGA